MVGVPKSKGCSTCRIRSIKCDEGRPSCSQCRRGGRKCPGYIIQTKFIDETGKLEARASRQATTTSKKKPPISSAAYEKGDDFALRASFNEASAAASDFQMLNIETSNLQPSRHLDGASDPLNLAGLRPDLRHIERQGIVASVIQDLFPLGRLTVQHSFIGSWLWRVPEALHRNPAMDLAAEALAYVYLAKKTGSAETITRSRKLYGGALKMLSITLHGQSSRFSSETLCATLLLVHFENFIAMWSKSWITHTNGAGRLIQLRGPDRHRTGFDHLMFMAFRPYLISKAVMDGTSCFLDNDKWRSIQIEDGCSPLMPPNYPVYHEALDHFAKVPGLMKDFKHLSDSDASIRRTSLYRRAKKLHADMLAWFEKLQNHPTVPMRTIVQLPAEAHAPFSAAYEYKDVITATFAVNCSAYLIQLNNMLDSLSNSQNHLTQSVALSKDICMSASYCARGGFCGIQAMAFVLPLAISALPEIYRAWAQLQISFFESIKESYTLRSTILDDRPVAENR